MALTLFSSAYEYLEHSLQQATISILKQGPIPRHVGFVLDGNRRFARAHGATSTRFGHYEGFRQLEKVLETCMQLGVEAVTVYAFSIENFKRSKEEVDYLMQLFREAFSELCEKNDVVKEYGIAVRFLGNISLLPPDVAEIALRTEERTRHNTKRIFNICCPYTSRDEISTAMRNSVKKVEQGHMRIRDINEHVIEQNLFTAKSPPLDILVRTSGEIRLSDFLLWQSSKDCHIQFVKCYWPQFSLWRFLPVLLEYQMNYRDMMVSICLDYEPLWTSST
ncbi:hypothetical protein K450DRAFT_223619 [Umbelopsis ramanniana AG]|uniref:Alkyl transferase n=1 Tax=Umbelopsis ramanniana AG TaxID=1314678 RepID=A0AAD5HIM0_UMBRA|nr:uncharacterized protein K450DRAFT_223619 [Umbelopsis ramanniana AG]KAI8583428.1 hypothetical protein K450DRAFT_223619 [Umbelopsis ramanniana AG]